MQRNPKRFPSVSATRLGLIVGIPLAIVAGVPALSLAAQPLKMWASGDTLTAADLNANFTSLHDHVARFDAISVANGNIGIGTTTPKGKLDVIGFGRTISTAFNVKSILELSGPSTSNSAVIFDTGATAGTTSLRGLFIGSASQDFHVARFDAAGAAAPALDLTVTSSGNIGIGSDTPATRLQVVGDIRVGTAGSNGCIQNFAGGAVAGTCSSDGRFKTNVRAIEGALAKLSQLRPVTYEWNVDAFPERRFARGTRSTGLLAQDVERVLPELVATGADGYKAVDYGAQLQMWTIAALNEATTELGRATARLRVLEAKIATLEGKQRARSAR
jgi:hypothetical protein